MEQNLKHFIKYCYGYISLTRQRTIAAQQRDSTHLPEECFGLLGLLNLDLDGKIEELINLETFYSLDPKNVAEEKRNKYEQEKALANKIEDIYNKYRNNQFTKQILINFGYFKVEIPIESEENETDLDYEEDEELNASHAKADKYPLFALPVRIEKENGKYFVYTVDAEIQVNIGILEPILGEDLYLQLVGAIAQYEQGGKLSLPIKKEDIFIQIWREIKDLLKLKDVIFDEQSFKLKEIQITLSPRANYFLADDMQRLLERSEEELGTTALTSWTENEDLSVKSEIPHEKDLYFPFPYNKYQLGVLSRINNKAAIVEGPPGTGKSETIANLICHFAATGKKVLFVSQKAQAIKVVKDKLKTLDVKYLFGYVPNPRSDYLGEEDKIDGVAPQLSGLSSYMAKLDGKGKEAAEPSHDLAHLVEEKNQLKRSFIDEIERERKIWRIHEELKSLNPYDIPIANISSFNAGFYESGFSYQQWKNIKMLKTDVEEMSNTIRDYEQDAQKEKFEKRFSDLELNTVECIEAVENIKSDVVESSEGKHSKIGWKRLKKEKRKMPRELFDDIKESLHKNITKNTARQSLEDLYRYCKYCFYRDRELGNLQNQLKDVLEKCGLSERQFEALDNILVAGEANEIEEIKNKVLRVHEIKRELEKLNTQDINRDLPKVCKLQDKRKKRISFYLQNIINKNLLEKWEGNITVRQIAAKLARTFGRSKKAFKTFDSLRKDPNNFNAILDLIPIWIMELDDASRIIPLEAGIFDYVILDEASQCNVAYTVPSMFRAKRALFFGDSEQMRDSTIIFKSNKSFDALARQYQIPDNLQIKATGSPVQSVLDMGSLRGFPPCILQYYYRSSNELIGFSNKHFYKPKGKELITINSNYITYKDTNRIMITHYVDSDWSHESADNINIAEAEAILELFIELKNDERYKGKSVAILSFFNAQAAYIRKLFEEKGYKEEKDNYKISIIEGIQGDEKDIIIYSFVIRTPDQRNKYVPLTGERGDIQADINKGRVNVAFSRARVQVHCFVSMPINEFPNRIWIKKYLEYIEENGEVDFDSSELKPFDSYFEEEFYNLARQTLKRGYKIQNQVESCGFKIDFVISDISSGKRLAVECDGPTHFKDEIDEQYGIYTEDDEERQRILEDAGWVFCRIKYSDWISKSYDKHTAIQDIVHLFNA